MKHWGQYVALAEDLGLLFYTFDQRILKNCPNLAFEPI
jgi:predicted nucleic acid-binding protein